MSDSEPDFSRIKDGFYLVNSPEVRENPWYIRRRPGVGTYAEVADNIEVGVFIAPWPFNRRYVVEEFKEPENRKLWDEAGVPEVILMAYEEILRRLAAEESS